MLIHQRTAHPELHNISNQACRINPRGLVYIQVQLAGLRVALFTHQIIYIDNRRDPLEALNKPLRPKVLSANPFRNPIFHRKLKSVFPRKSHAQRLETHRPKKSNPLPSLKLCVEFSNFRNENWYNNPISRPASQLCDARYYPGNSVGIFREGELCFFSLGVRLPILCVCVCDREFSVPFWWFVGGLKI